MVVRPWEACRMARLPQERKRRPWPSFSFLHFTNLHFIGLYLIGTATALFQFFRRPVFRSHRGASGVLPGGVPVQVQVPHCRESPSRSERQGDCEFCCVGYWLCCCGTCKPPCDKFACGGCHIAGFRKGASCSCWAKPPRSSQAWWSRTVRAYQAARNGGWPPWRWGRPPPRQRAMASRVGKSAAWSLASRWRAQWDS